MSLVVVLAAAIGLYSLMNSRTFQLAGTLVSHVETDEKVVALTFDDGPTARTPELLATLDAADVPATFYLIGKDLAAHPEYGKQIVDAGHEIGNHSFSHRRMVFVTPGTVRDEIERTDAEIRKTGFSGDITFRPPYGKKIFALPKYLADHGRTSVTWDVEPDSGVDHTREQIVDETVSNTKPGSIILLHAMEPGRAESAAAVPDIVARLKADGYRFTTVSDLLTGG